MYPGGPLSGADSTTVNVLAPFATDLTAAASSGTQYRVATTGTAPNRVCTVQWKNVADKPRRASASDTVLVDTQYASFSFQAKLYETSGQIDFVYGPATPGSGPDASRTVAIGIKGSSAQPSSLASAAKAAASAWATASFLNNRVPFAVRRSLLPDAGRTYRFRTNATSDAAVQAVYTLGQVPVGTPQAVRAAIHNAGTQTLTNLPVRLDVNGPGRSASGAAFASNNTQPIASLAPGATAIVTFAAYTVGTHLGTNAIAVTLPADSYPDTDVAAAAQVITANSFAYVAPTAGPGPGFYGFDTRAGITAVKYTAPRATTLLSVTDFILTNSNSTGRTIYAVAADAAGNILGRTPDYVVRAADLGTVVTFTFPVLVPVGAVDFLVGIAQPTGAVAHYPVGMIENALPQAGVFYDRSALTSGAFTDVSARNLGPFLIGAVATNSVLSAASAVSLPAFTLAPNPATGAVQLLLPATAGTRQAVQVLDALGRTVATTEVFAGTSQVALSVAGLPRGLYVVRVGNTAQRLVLE